MEERSAHSSLSDINSEDAVESEPLVIPRQKRICLVGEACNDPALRVAAQNFDVPVLTSCTGIEYIEDTIYCNYFVLRKFKGPEYDVLQKTSHRILGPTALLQLAERKDALPHINRPMYTKSMLGYVVVFTGFRDKDELVRLIDMVYFMGGSVRKEMGCKVTHLISNRQDGDKYKYAVIFRVPIMSVDWVITLWNNRDDIFMYGNNVDLVTNFKLEPCVGAILTSPQEEKRPKCDVFEQQGAVIIPRKKRICLVGTAGDDPSLGAAAQQFSVPVLKSETGLEYIDDTTYCTYYILQQFEGHEYDALRSSAHRILGPTALLQLAGKKEPLPSIKRPLYTQAMVGIVVAFTGFRKRDELTKLINMIHNMGGSIRKEIEFKVTHLIANCCGGEKYKDANMFKVPIMSMAWITTLWQGRDDPTIYGHNEQLMASYKLKPFVGAKICFHGFPEDEKRHMCEVSQQQGGEPVEMDDPNCTHMVVDESNVNSLPELSSVKIFIVKSEWFWKSVQHAVAADEKEYLFENYLEAVLSPTASARRDSQTMTPNTTSARRKRKRIAETISNLVNNGTDSPAVFKRRSSVSDAGHLSVSGSFLDCTMSPNKQMLDDIPEVEAVNSETVRKNLSPRHQVFLELFQTESNYVCILSTIMTLFKSPLEDLIETNGELLNSTEAKIIFGNFPPIYEVHKNMLEELRYSAAHWTEDISIGNIFLKYAPDLVKAYPSYVNFFENTKEMLDQCDQNKPRFHAFLKICQAKPECGRQSLKELLIKPVQRLPSISLLLTDILKHTNKNNSDHSALELSISSIKEVMTYINEDKRKTEGQLAMFDIFNEIENCPPHLVSSHRSFIGKCDVVELSEGLSGRGDHLVFFLFTDTLEICKKRSKAFGSLKSPNATAGLHSVKLSQGKPYKHIKMLPLSSIRKVVDIRETDECQKVFALMVRSNQELREKSFSFTITDEDVNKNNYLRTLCRQMANTVCKADADTFLISLDSHQLEIDTSDVALGTLSKAFKFASRTRMKVGRAFSFNKTPSKLKRAMSTMMSPFGSTHSLTPASQQLAQMRLASCNNINELGNGSSTSPSRDDVLVAPMSVQPTRKAKCGSLSMASLRRL